MTQLRILIKTPIGYAKSTEFKLRPFLLGRNGKLHKIMTNAEDNKILWIVEADPNQYIKIIKNVSAYTAIMRNVLSNKTLRRVAKISKEDGAKLDEMLQDQTEIDIIKENELAEIMKEFKEI